TSYQVSVGATLSAKETIYIFMRLSWIACALAALSFLIFLIHRTFSKNAPAIVLVLGSLGSVAFCLLSGVGQDDLGDRLLRFFGRNPLAAEGEGYFGVKETSVLQGALSDRLGIIGGTVVGKNIVSDGTAFYISPGDLSAPPRIRDWFPETLL